MALFIEESKFIVIHNLKTSWIIQNLQFYVTHSDTQIVLGIGMRAIAETGAERFQDTYYWLVATCDLFMSRKANYSGQSSKESKYAMPCISAATFTTHSYTKLVDSYKHVYNRQWPAGYEKEHFERVLQLCKQAHIIGKQMVKTWHHVDHI